MTLGKSYACLNLKTLDSFMEMLETTLGYLEKASKNNLGDFTTAGKTVNAGYNNYTMYWKYYEDLGFGNWQKQPYCAGYVSSMLATAFGLETAKKLLCGNLYTYCPDGYNRFNAVGRIHSTPKRGDVVFFWSTSLNRWGHTGFVFDTDKDAKGYTTIEANTSSGNDIVVRNGGATCRKHYVLGSGKVAFGRPDYAGCGIDINAHTIDLPTYGIGTGAGGLTVKVTGKINVRTEPGSTSSATIVKQLSDGDKFYPTLKAFVNGKPWIYDPNHGWMSANYVEGWMQEFTVDNKWWYVLKDYQYPVSQFKCIDDITYYFDDAGYMFVGTLKVTTDASGALKKVEEV